MKILFVDFKSSENYDFQYMHSNSLGGTQSTVLRVARELAIEHEVYISQINRDTPYQEQGIHFIHHDDGLLFRESPPDRIIILRKQRLLKIYSNRYPDAKLFVWIHNFQKYEALGRRHLVTQSSAKIICVSHHHQKHTDNIMNGPLSWLVRAPAFQYGKVPITFIYNPVDEAFSKSESPVDRNKLLFFSTANKGLTMVVEHFGKLLQRAPDYRLYIAGSTLEQVRDTVTNTKLLKSNSVIVLGKIPREEIINHLHQSFCLFYPQNIHPETFGLVYIEANCTGTPVLAHPFGSAAEVVNDEEQLVDARDSSAVIERLLRWRENGRPVVSCQERFRLQGIVKRWKEVLELNG